MDKYRMTLEEKGLDSDHSYKAGSRLGDMHELFSQLSDEDRIVLQQLWGEQFIRELERYGRCTRKQASLFVDIDQDRDREAAIADYETAQTLLAEREP